jgi:hypothetical protein
MTVPVVRPDAALAGIAMLTALVDGDATGCETIWGTLTDGQAAEVLAYMTGVAASNLTLRLGPDGARELLTAWRNGILTAAAKGTTP